jgi:N-acetylglutamate synthase-like GNAT family acetyltransferase
VIRLHIRTSCVVVLEEQGTIVGLGIAETRSGTWYLAAIAVAPAHQRKGLGTSILEHLLAQAPPARRFATAIGVTDAGRGFFRKLGFQADGDAFQRAIGRAG